MDLSPLFKEQKFYYLDEALTEVHNVEALLNILNDMQNVSNEAKAKFDIMLADIYCNLGRLLNSFEKKLNESDTQRQADASALKF